jgi:hypothetical protein
MGVKVREKVKGSGIYWVFIDHNGKRASKCVGSQKAADKVREIIEARIKLGQTFLPEEPKAVPTLKEYYDKFSETYMVTSVSESTRISYAGSFRLHILPALGTKRLGSAFHSSHGAWWGLGSALKSNIKYYPCLLRRGNSDLLGSGPFEALVWTRYTCHY